MCLILVSRNRGLINRSTVQRVDQTDLLYSHFSSSSAYCHALMQAHRFRTTQSRSGPELRQCKAHLHLRSTQQLRPVMAAAGKRVIALDFDGVVCDSVGESSLSAFKAAAIQWPDIFTRPEAEAAKPDLVEKMRLVRPVVETGYENIVQIRCLYEGVTVQDMLDNWHDMLPAKMKEWGLDRQKLVKLFGSVRDGWIAEDLQGWLAPNRIYPGVADAVRATLQSDDTEVYIVTTKQAHYTDVLMRDMAGVQFPAERIHSTTLSGEPKASVLARLAEEHPGADAYVFVEDKYLTLEKVAKEAKTQDWQLLLVDWGYNTEPERAAAAAHPKITVVDIDGFKKLLHAEAAVGS